MTRGHLFGNTYVTTNAQSNERLKWCRVFFLTQRGNLGLDTEGANRVIFIELEEAVREVETE